MSIARALTVRLRRHGASPATTPLPVDAEHTAKRMASALDRSKISSPVQLISSTNMLSYEAPDVATVREMRQISSSSSSSITDDSDSSSTSDGNMRHSTEDLTDASSVDNSPLEPLEYNHLSCYFEAAHTESQPADASNRSSLRRSASTSFSGLHTAKSLAPAIPARALSHSKSSHLALARKRSLQSLKAPNQQTASSPSIGVSRSSSLREPGASSASIRSSRSSAVMADGASNHQTHHHGHPFGRELEKLSEVVEELGGMMREAEDEDDGVVMLREGLSRWTADDYLRELGPLYLADFGSAGENHPAGVVPAWI